MCEANHQRRRIQQIDKKFRTRSRTRFRSTSARQTGKEIRLNGDLITDSTEVLCALKDHFEALGHSRKNAYEVINTADRRVNELLLES